MASAAPRSGFVRALFQGRIELASLLPFPTPDDETRETADEIVAMVSDWAAGAIDPAAIDRTKNIPLSVIEGLKELGLFGLTIPEAYGGAGAGQYTYARMMEAVAHRCASTVTVLGAHLGIGMKGLLLFGTPEQKQRWLPALATGERIAAFALTEASAGSDAAALRTTADPAADGGWRLDGRKIWITNGGIANTFTVFARTPHPDDPDAPLLERPISAFIVPAATEGVSIGAPEAKMGLCGSSTTEVGLDGVLVPADHLLGERGRGFKIALEVLNSGRHGLAACCIGQARLARDLAMAHALEREQFGQPIARFGMVAEMLASMEADLWTMEAGTWFTATSMDRGEVETMLEAACCKMFATEALWRIANDALQVTGGTGFMREYPYERIIRDARINMIFEGTNQVLRMMLVSQGLRPWIRGEVTDTPLRPRIEGLDACFDPEREELEELVQTFGASSRALAAAHGARVRDAQLPLRRLADQAVALFGSFCVLGRIQSRIDSGTLTDAELAVARLALRRRIQEFHHAASDAAHADDELVRVVAQDMERRA